MTTVGIECQNVSTTGRKEDGASCNPVAKAGKNEGPTVINIQVNPRSSQL